ncbi:MAG: hypothetical protein QY326_05350 [Bdellovibrionota bacterium]|nr:MAG: hypothetical protein QY326_05350 [Bdellovibrionota bacterium]
MLNLSRPQDRGPAESSGGGSAPQPVAGLTESFASEVPGQAIPFHALQQRHAPRELEIKGLSLDQAAALLGELMRPNQLPLVGAADLQLLLLHADRGSTPDDRSLEHLPIDNFHLIIDLARRYRVSSSGIERLHEVQFELLMPRQLFPIVIVQQRDRNGPCSLIITWEDFLQHISAAQIAERWNIVERSVASASGHEGKTLEWTADARQSQRYSAGTLISLYTCPRLSAYEDITGDPHPSQRPDLIHLCALRDVEGGLTRQQTLEFRLGGIRARLEELKVQRLGSLDRAQTDQPTATTSRAWLEERRSARLHHTDSPNVQCLVVEGYIVLITPASTGQSVLEDLDALAAYESKFITSDLHTPMQGIRSIGVRPCDAPELGVLAQAAGLPSNKALTSTVCSFMRAPSSVDDARVVDALINGAAPRPLELLIAEQLSLFPFDELSTDDASASGIDDEPYGDGALLHLVGDPLNTHPADGPGNAADNVDETTSLRLVRPFALDRERFVELYPSNGSPYDREPHLSVYLLPREHDAEAPGELLAVLEYYGGLETLGEHGDFPPELAQQVLKQLGVGAQPDPVDTISMTSRGVRMSILSPNISVVFH